MATNGGYVYSCHSQHGGMDRVIDMAIYVIFYNFLFGCLRMAFRHPLDWSSATIAIANFRRH